MHDAFNTRGGEVGFSVEFADGDRLTERECTWDEVPQDRPIRSLAIARLGVDVDYVRLRDFRRFYFSNEAVSIRPDRAVGKELAEHSAKVLGGVRSDGTVVEARIEFTPAGPQPSQRTYSIEECPFVESAFRPGLALAASG